MDDAVDRLTVGPKRIGIELGHQGQCRRATTEVGVAMTSHLLRRYENAKVECCDRISITPRGQVLILLLSCISYIYMLLSLVGFGDYQMTISCFVFFLIVLVIHMIAK